MKTRKLNFWKLFLLLPLCLTLSTPQIVQGKNDREVGTVAKAVGQVYRIPKGHAQKKPLKNNERILEGDKLISLQRSFIKVLMDDDTVMNLGPGSEFEIKEFKMKTKSDRTSVYNLAKGKMRAIFTVKAKKKDALKIKTPNVAMGVRGTEILSNVYQVKGAMNTDIALLSGKMNIDTSQSGINKVIQVTPGELFNSGDLAGEIDIDGLKLPKINNESLKLLRTSRAAFLPNVKNETGNKIDIDTTIKKELTPKTDIENQVNNSFKNQDRGGQRNRQRRRNGFARDRRDFIRDRNSLDGQRQPLPGTGDRTGSFDGNRIGDTTVNTGGNIGTALPGSTDVGGNLPRIDTTTGINTQLGGSGATAPTIDTSVTKDALKAAEDAARQAVEDSTKVLSQQQNGTGATGQLHQQQLQSKCTINPLDPLCKKLKDDRLPPPPPPDGSGGNTAGNP